MALGKIQIFSLILMLMLFGCASKQEPEVRTEYVYKTQTVEVPIYKVMPIKPLKCPVLPVSKLNECSSYSDISSAYYNSVQILLNYTKSLEKSLQPSYEAYIQNGN